MKQRKPPSTSVPTAPDPMPGRYRSVIWIFWLLNSLIILPLCLDWQLVPRFFSLAFFIGISLILLWKDLRLNADWRLSVLDIALLGWFVLNTAGIFWAFSWSEAVFFAQKTGLFFGVYWLVRQVLLRHETGILQSFRRATLLLTMIVIVVTAYETLAVVAQHGLDNQHLYDNIRILYGNKSLTADFLFFLLIFNGLSVAWRINQASSSRSISIKKDTSRAEIGLAILFMAILFMLIIALQTRTVYLAIVGAGGLWLTLSLLDPSHFFRKKKWLLLAVGLAMAGALYLVARSGGTLAERLNPMTYLDSDTSNERRFVWYKTDLLNREHYWWGVGTGSWKFRWPEQSMQGSYRMEQLQVAFTRAHNDYLEIRAELGIIGALWFCGLFVLVAVGGLWSWWKGLEQSKISANRHNKGSENSRNGKSLGLLEANSGLPLLLAGIFGYCIIQYFDFPRERMEMQVALALLFAFTAHFSQVFWQKLPGYTLPPRVKTWFLLFLALNAVWGLCIGWYRISGEMHNIRLLQAIGKRNNLTVIREARAAMNPFYEYDDVTLPLPWYEGSAYQELKQLDKSLAAFKRAVELNPWNYQTLNNYATVMVQAAQPGDLAPLRAAVPLFEEAIRINPRHHDGKFNLAFTYWSLGEYKKASEWVEKVDTIRNPANEDDRELNRFLKNKQQEFRTLFQNVEF